MRSALACFLLVGCTRPVPVTPAPAAATPAPRMALEEAASQPIVAPTSTASYEIDVSVAPSSPPPPTRHASPAPYSIAGKPGTATIRGRVRNEWSGETMPGLVVIATAADGTIASGHTDAHGDYALTRLPAKTWTLRFHVYGREQTVEVTTVLGRVHVVDRVLDTSVDASHSLVVTR